jgi:hypothetical protein
MNKTENLKTLQAVVLFLVLVLFFSVLACNQAPNTYKALFNDYIAAFSYSAEVQRQLLINPQLLSDKSWQTELGQSFERLNLKADELAKLSPTPKYIKLHSITVKLASETHLFTEAYTHGIDNVDNTSLDKALQHLFNMAALMQDVITEMN